MADIAAARAEVQKVVAFLVNRFGSEAEVFAHATAALAHLQDDPVPPPPLSEVIAEEGMLEPSDPEVPEVVEEIQLEEEPEVPLEVLTPKKARRQNRRRKGVTR